MYEFALDFGEFAAHAARAINDRPYNIIGKLYRKR